MARRTTLTCLLPLLIGMPSSPKPPAPTLHKLDPLLQQRVSSLLGSSQIIVRAIDSGSVGAVALLVQQGGVVLGRVLPIIDALAARVPNASLLILAASPVVQHISLDRPTLST